MDASDLINTILNLKHDLRQLDSEGIYHYYNPNTACSEQDINQAENYLGTNLDQEYVEFLKCANGWKEFFQSITLFGTQDLISSPLMERARKILEAIRATDKRMDVLLPPSEDLFLEERGLLPIAVDEYGIDLFVLTPTLDGRQSMVIWFAGYEVERYPSFRHFLNAIIGYLKDEIQDFKNDQPR